MSNEIVVVGSYNTGFLIHVDRLPTRGETLPGRGFRMEHGGKGSNQAIQAARLGCRTAMIAAVGDDIFGERAIKKWRNEGVETAYVKRCKTPTGAGLIIVGPGGENMIAVDLGANLELTPSDVDEALQRLSGVKIVLTQLEIPLETALHALALAQRNGAMTILNPAPAARITPAMLRGVSIITPNEVEAKIMAGLGPDEQVDLAELARTYCDAVEHVVITLGERGALIVDSKGERIVKPPRVDAVDATGAGDAFNGALAAALARGMDIDTAVEYACAAGAFLAARIKRGELIEALATREELERFKKQQQ